MRTCYIFVLFFIAMSLFTQGVYAESAQDWIKKGDNLSNLGDAINAYDKAIKIDPKDARAWYNKITRLSTNNKKDEADSLIDSAIIVCDTDVVQSDDGLFNLWDYKISTFFETKKYNECIDFIDQLLMNHQNMAVINKRTLLETKWLLFLELKQYDAVIDTINQEIQIDPTQETRLWRIKGDVFKDAGNYDEARKAYNYVLTLLEKEDNKSEMDDIKLVIDEVNQLSNSNKNVNTNSNNYNSGSPNNQNQAYYPNNDQVVDNTGETNENSQVTSSDESEDYCCVQYLNMCYGDHDEKKYYAKGCTTADANKCARAHGMLPP